MDEKKKIKKMIQDPLSFQLKLETTLEILPKDQLAINYSDFDEFIMSDSLMHWDDYVIYISESKRRDEYTWRSSKIMAENHKFIEGPKQAKNTGMIYYLEQFECSNNDYGPVEEDDNNDAHSEYSNELSKKDFKGFSIVLTPPADRSFLEILPQFNENFNNFISYIDSKNIIARYSGRFFVFHSKGQFLGQV